MPRPTEIQAIIEEAVAEVLTAALPGLRVEIVRRITAQLEALSSAPGTSPTDLLNEAAASIQEAGSQAEILRRLLEGESKFGSRVALFVVRGGTISGWQGIGFQDNDVIKSMNLNGSSSLVARAVQERIPVGGSISNFDGTFLSAVKPPAEDNCVVLPLVVKDKVAALIYGDAGVAAGGTLDAPALSTLTRMAALWLELTALRKAGVTAPEEAQPAAPAPPPAPVAPPAPAPAPAAAAAAPAPVEDELHRKAKRFAKLLVEEIKLYNQPRVAEGKHNRDLYDRLREDIEKSRATYQKRYGETPAAEADFFNQELIRILADNDVSLMGTSFPR
ncbi:MAG TPA: hypothetical protein VKE93_11075 [Candidatus Angelobacter sp.]|nr:hypothetical protein [Candidatus Angelobacter sp.]